MEIITKKRVLGILGIIAILIGLEISYADDKKLGTGEDDYDVIVIGAGGGGLSAAARCSKEGLKTLVIEQHHQVGGYMSGFEQGDYRFEASLEAMDGMGALTFDKLGIKDKVKAYKLDPVYKACFPDFEFVVPADVEEYKKKLIKTFPHEEEGINDFFSTFKSINITMENLFSLQDGTEVISSLASLIFNPWNIWPVIKYWDSNCTDMLDEYLKDEKLIAIFTQLMAYTGINADNVSGMLFALMWNSYHHHGFYYFEGGSHAVTKACAEVVKENGGKVLLSTLATKIIIKDGMAVAVRAQDLKTKVEKEYKCRYVVSNANVPDTVNKLIGKENLPEDYVRDIENMKTGASTFAVYLGVDHDYSNDPNAIHSIFVNPANNAAESFRYFTEGNPEKAMFSIVNYTMKDPTNAPKGKNAINIVSMLPYDYMDNWQIKKGDESYKALKEKVAQIYIKRAEKYLPGLEKYIEEIRIATPLTLERYTLNPFGTIFGWEYNQKQSMLNRLPQDTPINNLFLAGAWTFPGGGQGAVLTSGSTAAGMILSNE